jgi:methyl-accepting chemotaxis protein
MKKVSLGKNVPKAPSRFMIFSIRNKIMVCFMIPIVFIVIIGYLSESKASEGMSKNFNDSTLETVQMAMQYIDMSASFIEAVGRQYAFDPELKKYIMGFYSTEPTKEMQAINTTRTSIAASQVSNPFIFNIHIIPEPQYYVISTGSGVSSNGFATAYRDDIKAKYEGKLPFWIDSHTFLDETLGLPSDKYIMSYEINTDGNTGVVVVDVSTQAIQEFLDSITIGTDGIIAFVTGSGREIYFEDLAEGQESTYTDGEQVVAGESFFAEVTAGEEDSVLRTVNYKGKECVFFYQRSTVNDSAVCALVPTATITAQAGEIKTLTIQLVLVAALVAVVIGWLLAVGIQRNMKRISLKLGQVAKGDLTVPVAVKGRDEFRNLRFALANMITSNKHLVGKVGIATKNLEKSADNVEEASAVIHDYSTEITQAIHDINDGMTRQAEQAQKCVTRTDLLSNEIQDVKSVTETVEELANRSVAMISHSMHIVRELGKSASDTNEITAKVGKSIEMLRKESEVINEFVEVITNISKQTNLLSLNASIEAARAGASGKGFAVVASEIRKLAENSANAAGEIRNNVKNITSQTDESVANARASANMVKKQTDDVNEMIRVFQDMDDYVKQLLQGLKEISSKMEVTDQVRVDTLRAVEKISAIIEETAGNAEVVQGVAQKLTSHVGRMNDTAKILGENMEELKQEISVFKTEEDQIQHEKYLANVPPIML